MTKQVPRSELMPATLLWAPPGASRATSFSLQVLEPKRVTSLSHWGPGRDLLNQQAQLEKDLALWLLGALFCLHLN